MLTVYQKSLLGVSGLRAVNPFSAMGVVYPPAGISTIGSTVTGWTPSKYPGVSPPTLSASASVVTGATMNGHTSAASNGGRLTIAGTEPAVPAVGGRVTYLIAGHFPVAGDISGGECGFSGSATGTKPYPFIALFNGVNYALVSGPTTMTGNPKIYFDNDITDWLGEPFFAILSNTSTGDSIDSSVDIYCIGQRFHLPTIVPPGNAAVADGLGGLTLLGYEGSNGEWRAGWSYFAAASGWFDQPTRNAWLNWGIREFF